MPNTRWPTMVAICVLHPVLDATILEASGEPLDQSDRLVGSAEEQRAGVRGNRTAVERRYHPASLDHSKVELRRATLRRHRGTPLHRAKALSQKTYRRFQSPDAPTPREKSGLAANTVDLRSFGEWGLDRGGTGGAGWRPICRSCAG